MNEPTPVAGFVGPALEFDGTQWVRIPDNPSLNPGTQDFTVIAWVKTSFLGGTLNDFIVDKGSVNKDHQYLLGYSAGPQSPYGGNGEPFFAMGDGTALYGAVGTDGIADGSFHHIAGVRVGTTLFLYVDGEMKATQTTPTLIDATSTNPLGIAGRERPDSDAYYTGIADEVALFDRALTAAEIRSVYEAGSAGMCNAPILSCSGFQSPMASGTVTARGNRALPLKAQLFDVDGFEMTDLNLVSPPVLQVIFLSATGSDAVDVTDDALPAGFGTDGNEFEFAVADGIWQYNLKTKNYSAVGTYAITMVSGDESEYIIDPTCEAAFERLE